MSLLIKGMEMPGNNNTVLFCVVDGKMRVTSLNRIHDGFHEVIELPEHGRLIDADALEQESYERILQCEKYGNQFQKPFEILRAIATATTIIEAEGGGME